MQRNRLLRTFLLVVSMAAAFAVATAAADGSAPSIVINEVCWSGAVWDHTAEWIELYNVTDAPIDLDGWLLVSSDGAPYIPLHGVISSPASGPDSGYFLLERGSDDSVPGVPADMIYQGALTDRGESLVLIDASGQIVDTANAAFDGQTLAWPAGTDSHGMPPYASMERVSFLLPDAPENWASCDLEIPEGTARGILGTPRAENSVYDVLPVAHMMVTPVIPHPGVAAEFNAERSSDSNDAIVAYHWQFGDGEEADGPVVTHAFAETGEYTITLVLTDSKGGQTFLIQTIQVAVTTPPIADFSLVLKPDQSIPRAGDVLMFQDESTDADSDIVSWTWRFGDGAEASGDRVPHSYATYGDYVIGLRVADAQGEVGIQTEALTIASRLPIVVFTVEPESPNPSDVVRFDAAESFDPDGQIVSYEWDFDGDGTIDETTVDPIADHTYSQGGDYAPLLYVVDDTGQRGMRERSLYVNFAPVARFALSSFEINEMGTIRFTDLSEDPDGEIVEWAWDFGDETTSNAPSPTHAYQRSGTMDVTLTVTDSAGAVNSSVATITVDNLPPTAGLTVADDTLPTASAFSFDASSSSDPSPEGGLVRYEWSIDSETDFELETTGPTLSHAFAEDGQYAVRVRVTDSDGAVAISEPLTVTVTNRPPIVSNATWSPADPMDGETVAFSLTASDPDGTVVSWSWTLSPGTSGSTQEFSYVFPDDGSYLLSITVRDDDGATSQPYTATIPVGNAVPVAVFTVAQGTQCEAASVQFDATKSYDPSPDGRIVHVAWDFGDGTTCPGSPSGCIDDERWTPKHCYSEPGTFIVTLFVIDEHGALTSTQKTIVIGE